MSAIRNVCVYCGSSEGADAALRRSGGGVGAGARGRGRRARLRRRRRRPDGPPRAVDARGRRLCDRDHPQLSHPQGTRAHHSPRLDRRRGHARTQASDVRSRRRFRRASRRDRHARGTGRADDLGAAQSPREADRDRQYRWFLAPVALAPGPHARRRLHSRRLRAALHGGGKDRGRRCRCCAPPHRRSVEREPQDALSPRDM